jgi:WD40 repeat protein
MEEDPQLFQQFKGHKEAITASSFSPNGKQVVSCSTDQSLMLWKFQSADSKAYRCERPGRRHDDLRPRYTGHTGPVLDVQFSRTGNLVASAARDGTVRFGNKSDMLRKENTICCVDLNLSGCGCPT